MGPILTNSAARKVDPKRVLPACATSMVAR